MIPCPDTIPKQHFFCQEPNEFVELLKIMEGSRSILEIGSRYGESLRWFAKHCPNGSRVVTIDLGNCPDNDYGHRTGDWWDDVCKEIAEVHEVHQLYGDSHDPKLVEKVRDLGPYDFIFIDGDHTEEGVRQDWLNYGHMGKIVAFHDAASLPAVFKVFETALQGRRHILLFSENSYGIGVVYNG